MTPVNVENNFCQGLLLQTHIVSDVSVVVVVGVSVVVCQGGGVSVVVVGVSVVVCQSGVCVSGGGGCVSDGGECVRGGVSGRCATTTTTNTPTTTTTNTPHSPRPRGAEKG